MTVKNEWTVFVRTQNTSFRPFISQFINFVDFKIPGKSKVISVDGPERSQTNAQEAKANYQIMTKI